MELLLSTDGVLIDEVPRLIVRGLPARLEVTVRVEVIDAVGIRWESVTGYRADSTGTVNAATSAPVSGGYEGVDATGPWWSMRPSLDPGRPAIAFTAPDTALTWSVSCRTPSGQSVRQEIVRRWCAQGVVRSEATTAGMRSVRFSPVEGTAARPIVVLVPGTTGVEAVTPTAALLASRCGFDTVVLGYASDPGRASALVEVPLESIAQQVAELARGRRVGVVAYSVGTGGALAALAYCGIRVDAVVAIAPTHVIWQALREGGPPPKTSAWSQAGQPMPYVPVRGELLLPQIAGHALARVLHRRSASSQALGLRRAYAAGLRDTSAVARAVIPVERISAPLMAVAGDADAMWPAAQMAQALLDRRRDRGREDSLLVLPGAGHFLRPPVTPTTVDRSADLISGGTAAANAGAQQTAWTAMTTFLLRHLPASPHPGP
ncbi:acyl-CoA thioesterase/bile acid-CoA:amino acid N-acyltransferase family protein [Streptomyces solincola]|uniref:acyl-CoA thioesterase/bile acid-CoA:amino acid N-acyltransferase family protein n=1 Tax=Streptomyces solincola TaxID=2100817 RepID=UPI0011B280C6|nr:acyl-CoA thioester hydrolase/BAAT C-terminal domain-containing protein [Streptomyces solincola]